MQLNQTTSNMQLRSIFQSVIALHQEELPLRLKDRKQHLPINKDCIVTVTGIRRCGKSSLLSLTVNRLLQSGVRPEQILYIGFDDERFVSMQIADFDEILQAYREMYPTQPLKDVYMFFDEIQLIEGWELFVLRVFKNYCKHIYITGSTAKMLSGEMASALRGWPDEYREYPLSFDEYLDFKDVKANRFTEDGAAVLASEFKHYCKEGGFPQVVLADVATEKIKILQSYFNTMLFRDMIEHYGISASPSVVRYFLKRVMNNITKPTSVNNIYNELKSQGMRVSKDSLYQWLDYACNIFLLRKVPKYTQSIVKQNLSPAKYYIADFAMRNAILLPQSDDEGKALENIVYMMLERDLGEEAQVFYFNETVECDFVVVKADHVEQLIQVCWQLDDNNLSREVEGLVAASSYTGCKNCTIVTYNQQRTIDHDGLSIDVVPVWK